jgi:hypothetical protein
MGQSRYATNIAAEQLRCASVNMNAGGPGGLDAAFTLSALRRRLLAYAIEYLRNHSSLTCEDCGVEIVLDNEQFQPA